MFVLPSYAEGLPVALLEAMSYALPVITTPVGGIPSVVRDGENGIMVNAGNIPELTDRIRYLWQHPEVAERLGQAARRTVNQRFGADRFHETMEQIYKKLCSRT
jgi:glycosyltransferase involved in cell wall biosynthesis